VAQILSQNEIDELLNALAGGDESGYAPAEEENKTRVRDYDFRMANKFPKEQMRTLRVVFEGFARTLATQLAGIMRIMCEADVVSVEEQAFSEFSNALMPPVVLTIFTFRPFYGSLMMQMSANIVDAIISRVFGGKASTTERNKAFTEIELVTIERLSRQVLKLLSESWGKIMDAEATFDRIETSPQFAQIVPPNETVAIITIKVNMKDIEDFITICIPHMAMEPVSKELNSRVRFEGLRHLHNQSHEDLISKRLSGTHVTLHAMLDPTTATVRELLNLHVGDVICLNHGVNKEITVMTEQKPKFKGHLGRTGGRYAIQVTRVIEEESDEHTVTG
jgi:flagellar motor switch protein FliM